MGFDGWFSKGGVHKTDSFYGFWNLFYSFWKLSDRGVYFGKYMNAIFEKRLGFKLEIFECDLPLPNGDVGHPHMLDGEKDIGNVAELGGVPWKSHVIPPQIDGQAGL